MTALGEVGTVTEIAPNLGVKMLMYVTPTTVIGGTDTVQVDLNDYGCTKLRGILGFTQTTDGSVVATSAPTTVVSSGVLVITTAAGGTNAYTYIIWAD